jgi:ribose 5-phosphate isomerase
MPQHWEGWQPTAYAVITDQGNFIIDVKFDGIDNPEELEKND